mgnify:CR=1 FL=1
MNSYQIIDEPKPKSYERFVVDPLAILFVSIIVPLFWVPPLMGKFWIPVIWILANGYFMGSPTLKRELLIAVLGLIGFLILVFAIGFIVSHYNQPDIADSIGPYFQILMQGTFFFTLYLIVFKQAAPYAIHQYLKEQSSAS